MHIDMGIYRYIDRVSYHDTMLYKYQNIKMTYSTEWCTSYVANITLILCLKLEVNILYLSEKQQIRCNCILITS